MNDSCGASACSWCHHFNSESTSSSACVICWSLTWWPFGLHHVHLWYRIFPSNKSRIRRNFFLWKNLVKWGKYPVPPGKNPVQNTWFFPLYSAPKRHSSLFLRTFSCRNTQPRPGPGPHPGPALPARSSPVVPPATEFFAGSVPFFFLDIPDFSIAWRNEGKIQYKRRKLIYSVHWSDLARTALRSAAQNVVPRHLVEPSA